MRRRTNQKFQRYDLVQIADDLGPCMSHFPKGKRAVIRGSYYDEYGGGAQERKEYSVVIEDTGFCAWYNEPQLTLIEENRPDLYEAWNDIGDDDED